MLKKILGITMILASLSVSAFAAIPRDQMHIGGLKPGMTLQQVAAMYGTPQKAPYVVKADKGRYEIAGGIIQGWELHSKGNPLGVFEGYSIGGYKPVSGSEKIVVTGDIKLGMGISDVVARLGKPDYTTTFNGGNGMTYFYNSIEKGIGWRTNDTFFFTFDKGRLIEIALNHYLG